MFQDVLSTGTIIVKMGLLAPWQNSYEGFSGLTSASAVSIALERIKTNSEFRKFDMR